MNKLLALLLLLPCLGRAADTGIPISQFPLATTLKDSAYIPMIQPYDGRATNDTFKINALNFFAGRSTTINPTNLRIPIRQNATTFANSPISITSGDANITLDDGIFFGGTDNRLYREGSSIVVSNTTAGNLVVKSDTHSIQLTAQAGVTQIGSTEPMLFSAQATGVVGLDNLYFAPTGFLSLGSPAHGWDSIYMDGGGILNARNAADSGTVGLISRDWLGGTDKVLVSPNAEDTIIHSAFTRFDGAIQLAATAYIDIPEVLTPAPPPANTARIFVRDNGAGKSQLVIIWPSSAESVLATEP